MTAYVYLRIVPYVNSLTPEQIALLEALPLRDGQTNRLAAALAITGGKQVDLAAAIGLPQAYVSDVMRHRYQTITVENAHKFAAFFGCSIEVLFPSRVAVA